MSEPVTVEGWTITRRGTVSAYRCGVGDAEIHGGKFYLEGDGDGEEVGLPLPVLAAMLRAVGWRVEEPE